MSNIVIIGLDSAAGYTLAKHWAVRHNVRGVSLHQPVPIEHFDCHTAVLDPDAIRELLRVHQTEQIVFTGANDKSAWDAVTVPKLEDDHQSACQWATVAAELGIPFTLISSNGLLTGPWLFHDEDSQSFCDSPEAQQVRATEQAVAEIDPQALIVRTHLLICSPQTSTWADQMVGDLQDGTGEFDCVRYAAPVCIEHLAGHLEQAWQAELSGISHCGTCERTNQLQVAQMLAATAGWAQPRLPAQRLLQSRPTGFGASESSLYSSSARRELQLRIPSIQECVREFVEAYQQLNPLPATPQLARAA